MKFSRLLTCLFTSICIYSAETHAGQCNMHETCQPDVGCNCSISAGGAENRSFYIDFSNIKKDVNYSCRFTSAPVHFAYNASLSRFPQGAEVTCNSGDCSEFPMILNINTQKMKAHKGNASIFYYVDPHNQPTDVTAKCTSSN